MDAAGLHHAATKPLAPASAPAVALPLPASLSGPVRARRRRLLPLWQPAVAHLRGRALVVETASGAILCALDVHAVRRSAAHSVAVSSAASAAAPRRNVRLRLPPAAAAEWYRALSDAAAAAARKPPAVTDFHVVAPVGKGGGGAVFLVRGRDDDKFAMKVVKKCDAFYSDGSLRRALDERVVLERVRGFPFVVQLRHAFQTDANFYMLTEFCSGGNLRTALGKCQYGRMSEQEATPLMAQTVLALEHVHSLDVAYRDLKPENVLLSRRGDVRLCDFGLAKVMPGGRFGRTRSFCGSTSYMSPQVVSGKHYGIATDMWSLGALFFRILVGRAPFDETPRGLATRNGSADIQRRIQFGDVEWPAYLSHPAREMLEALLTKSEPDRLNLQDLKESLFFQDVDWEAILRQGYDRMAVDEGDANGDDLANFDAERLRSHGVALEDKELRREAKPKDSGERLGFVGRQTSKLSAFSTRRRTEMTRKHSTTSIVGFGFSTDASSESATVSGSDDTFGSSLDGNRHRHRHR